MQLDTPVLGIDYMVPTLEHSGKGNTLKTVKRFLLSGITGEVWMGEGGAWTIFKLMDMPC